MATRSPATDETVHALLGRIIDYAGLFPPAQLDMAATVRNYADYLRSADAWMLGRLIVPVARLDEFAQVAESTWRQSGDAEEPWVISVLAAPAGSAELPGDIERIRRFNDQHGTDERAVIDMMELKADAAAAIDSALEAIPDELFPFFELPIANDARGLIAALADGDAGAKVRTGGVTADAYPRPEHLARFVAACAAARVPFKATAGLHQPLRHYSSAVKVDEFGFLNVFAAGCLAWADEMKESEVNELLVEADPLAIGLDERGLSWRDRVIAPAQIAQAREEFAVSFGSCSFDEPREALRAVKLLPLE